MYTPHSYPFHGFSQLSSLLLCSHIAQFAACNCAAWERSEGIHQSEAVDTIDGETKCSTIGCLGKRLGPRILGGRHESPVPEVMYQILDEPASKDEIQGRDDIPQTLEEFTAEVKESRSDARAFAIKLRAMDETAKIQEYLYRHVASSSIPKQLHCLALRLANEHSTNANARLQLPSAELVPYLVDNSYFHFVLASDNILAASVVASSLIRNALTPP
ncbi:putative galacturonosyltransferase 12 [Vitis vinifera]|uniref:Putative galacturonosyltransferase 12 n=1 Tax=Vitis vinifera TaxID=29760 RepID=A0A438DPH2_VITVI|nr:putative galacturonosyltransferase 12 [Vitis vinifera]